MSNLIFVTQEQCFESEKLDIFKKRGTKAAITDFSILLGGYVSDYDDDSESSLEGRTGYYWTKSEYRYIGYNAVRVVCEDGNRDFVLVNERGGGVRPALPFSSISKIPTNGESGKRARDDILEVEYGYYPQKAVSKDMQDRLEREFKNGRISKTRNTYTTDSRRYDAYYEKFEPKQHQEYEYNGKRYVRVEANHFGSNLFILSNGEKYRNGDNVWVEVAPVKWLVDEREKIMLTDKLILSGVQFNHTKDYHTRDFDKTDIKTFMDRYLARDLVQSRGTKTYGEQALSLHTGTEAGQYAQDGLEAYPDIEQMYSGYLSRDTKEVRGKDDDRS